MRFSRLLLIVVVLIFFGIIYFSFFNKSISLSDPVEFQDKNKDGIWDDVEPYINRFAQTPEQRSALEYKFKSFQEILLDPEIGTVLRDRPRGYDTNGQLLKQEPTDHMFKASACVSKVFGVTVKHEKLDFEQAILTSSSRIRAYLRFNRNLSGGSYTLWDEDKQGDPCLSH